MSAATGPFADRLARLRAQMAATATDLVVLGPSSHMVWLAGLNPHGDERPVLLVVAREGAALLMPALNADSQRGLTDLPFFTWTDAEGPQAALDALLVELKAMTPGLSVALDETMRADFALLLLDSLRAPKRKFSWDSVGVLRARKDEGEYRALKASALLNDSAMAKGFSVLAEGISEREVADAIGAHYLANGARREFTIVAFGENGAFPHHHTSERRLKRGDAVLIDTGCRLDGYPSDMTRVGFFGEASAEFGRVHGIVNAAVEAAIKAVRPGIPARLVDDAARGVIAGAGLGDRFLHRTGHGVGIDVHEPPYITATSETLLEEGHVFSIEPGIYLSGAFGIRLEEVVIIRNGAAEVLSELPRASFAGGR